MHMFLSNSLARLNKGVCLNAYVFKQHIGSLYKLKGSAVCLLQHPLDIA